MHDNDILREIRATRDAFAAAHNYDLRAMAATLRAEELASGRVVVSFEARPTTDASPERDQNSKVLLVPAQVISDNLAEMDDASIDLEMRVIHE